VKNNILFCSIMVFILFAVSVGFASVGQAGTLKFFANGEELITEGFIAPKLTKDGWSLEFSHAFVVLSDITAYQTDPPYDSHSGEKITADNTVSLEGVYVVDLAREAKNGSAVLVGEVSNAPAGHYNAISWKMVKDKSGVLNGYSMFLIGTAEKDGETVNFQIRTAEESTYRCGEFVGDERKGLLAEGEMADLEMTFHFDHIFGRADKDPQDPMNLEAAGFDPFSDSRKVHDIKLHGMHIGHAGEGHCAVEWH
jgi:hypothetical protein